MPNYCLAPLGNTAYSGSVIGGGPGMAASEMFAGGATTGPGILVVKVTAKTENEITVSFNADFAGTVQAALPAGSSVRFKAKQAYNMTSPVLTKECTIESYDPATVKMTLTEEDTQWFGTWISAFQIFSSEGKLIAEYPCYYQVEMGLESLESSVSSNALGIGMVRTALLDWCRDANTLLQDLEFPDWMIAAAIMRPIDDWNATPPLLGNYTPSTFPFREPWLRAVCGILLEQAAHKYDRNRLTHNAGGLTMDPNDKGRVYLEKSMILRKEWKEWVATMKTYINMDEMWGGTANIGFSGATWTYFRI